MFAAVAIMPKLRPLSPTAYGVYLSTPNSVTSRTEAREGQAQRLWFLGALPPPLNGQSNYNAAMLAYLSQRVEVTVLPLGESNSAKFRRLFVNSWALLRARRSDVAYLSLPGQMGLWLLLPVLGILRLRGITPWCHHHSFRPINLAPSRAMQALIAVAGNGQRHILLSPGMRDRFARAYLPSRTDACVALSNAFLFGPTATSHMARPERPVTFGHVSVLTKAKGVVYLLSLFERLHDCGHNIRLVIAGPSSDAELLLTIETYVARFPKEIEYRGPIAGDAKEAFYRDIDLFLLPTTLVDEAEPLVMLEAFAHGVDVLATNTGCIPDRILAADRLLTLEPDTDVTLIEQRMTQLCADWVSARDACIHHALAINAQAQAQAETVFPALLMTDAGQRTNRLDTSRPEPS